MARYIDANLAQSTIKELCDDYKISYGEKYGGFGSKISNIMESVPTADVQEVEHGKWKKVQNYATCSRCKHEVNWLNSDFLSPYCPHCGAQMDGKEDK